MAKPGISKSTGYLTRVFCVEYDLKGMVDAYGPAALHWMIDQLANNDSDESDDGTQAVRNLARDWSNHAHLYKFASTEQRNVKLVHLDSKHKIVKRTKKPSNKPTHDSAN